MTQTIMLYGATGYSGQLIAAEMQRVDAEAPGRYRMLLAGRDARALAAMAQELNLDCCVFTLEDAVATRRALAGTDVVINAAGPFAWTAERLLTAALDVGPHYVDINGEADVYQRLSQHGPIARERGVALVCSSGFWAAASSLLLEKALDDVKQQDQAPDGELGTVRSAMSRIKTFSQGSARTVWRSQREQVLIAGKGQGQDANGDPVPELVLWREPVGRLEQVFDFAAARHAGSAADRRITSAVSLVDTLVARLTLQRRALFARRIESYVEAGFAARLGYQLGAMAAPVIAIPAVRALLQQPVALLPVGPDAHDRRVEPHTVVLQIEDVFRSRVIDWCWTTPNVYQFTAQLALGVALQIVDGQWIGWLTPGQVLAPQAIHLTASQGALRDCVLTRRRT